MKDNTLIFIDWDDTLFPTSWITKNKIDVSDKRVRDKYLVMFSELDNVLYKFLKKALSLGDVIIVTNASRSWIDLSMKLLPQSSKIIDAKIKIVSARDKFGHHSDTYVWKQFAFEEEAHVSLKDKKDVHNIISIGDAEYEHKALIKFYDWSKIVPQKRILKKIKFLSSPTYYSVIDQINVLTSCLDKICLKKKHVDLVFVPKS